METDIVQIVEVVQTGGIIALLILGIKRYDTLREIAEERENEITDDYIEYLKKKANGESKRVNGQ